MFSGKKKEDKLDVLTEDKIQQKLYGYLTEAKRLKTKFVQQSTQISPQHILQPEKQKDASGKFDNSETEKYHAIKERIKPVWHTVKPATNSIGFILSFIKKVEESLPFGKQNCFTQIKKLKIPMLLILVLIFGVFVLIMRKRPVSSSVSDLNISTQTSLPAKKVEEIVFEKGPFYTIQVCVYQKAKDANRLIEELKQKNLDAYLYTDSSKSRAKYLVYVGRFHSPESAKVALGKLKTMFKDSFVRRIE